MKRTLLMLPTLLLIVSCHGQEHQKEQIKESTDKMAQEEPEGTWKVNREFDEDGNLIRYDSIYSWSSSNYDKNLAKIDRDSLLQSFTSRFSNGRSPFDEEGFNNFFADDSLFTQHFFSDDFFESKLGKDFMDLNQMQKHMEAMQHQFMKRYGPESEQSKKEHM
ncbi:hypothetical protein [Flagellimonas iocasae]|uniref:Lipoprotein n=1 Tax=Flagellimonas iocasae TaxID=2055905 RepID=A0ABW4XZQ9_9FLAO